MCEIRIMDVTKLEHDKGHRFTLYVSGEASDRANIQWFERTTRCYPRGPEIEGQWEELRNKNTGNAGMFREAEEAIDEYIAADCTGNLAYTITDEPQISLASGGRTLEFVFAVRMSDDAYYLAAGKQVITVEKDESTKENRVVECSLFMTDFVKIDDDCDFAFDDDSVGNEVEDVIETCHLGELKKLI